MSVNKLLMKIKTPVIESYVERHLRNQNYGKYAIREIKIILITEEKSKIIVDYEVEVSRQFWEVSPLVRVPKVISGSYIIRLDQVDVTRELKLMSILNPD